MLRNDCIRFLSNHKVQLSDLWIMQGIIAFLLCAIRRSSNVNIAMKNVKTKTYVTNTVTAAYKQNDCNDGRTVIDPTAKATISVTEVTVIDAPACASTSPI